MRNKYRIVNVSFTVSGSVSQKVRITDPLITPEMLQSYLRKGEVVTTIQEGGTVEFIKDGQIVGKVIDVDNECSYEDFEVTVD